MPICQQRIAPVLDTATCLLVVTLRRGREIGRREILLGSLAPAALARAVAELSVQVVLCAALSESLHRALRQSGVRVRAHLCGEVEAVLGAFCQRRLGEDQFRMPGCWGIHRQGRCCPRRRVANVQPASRSLAPVSKP